MSTILISGSVSFFDYQTIRKELGRLQASYIIPYKQNGANVIAYTVCKELGRDCLLLMGDIPWQEVNAVVLFLSHLFFKQDEKIHAIAEKAWELGKPILAITKKPKGAMLYDPNSRESGVAKA